MVPGGFDLAGNIIYFEENVRDGPGLAISQFPVVMECEKMAVKPGVALSPKGRIVPVGH
jgi:hypothetical protein